jgi:hypothetical protein
MTSGVRGVAQQYHDEAYGLVQEVLSDTALLSTVARCTSQSVPAESCDPSMLISAAFAPVRVCGTADGASQPGKDHCRPWCCAASSNMLHFGKFQANATRVMSKKVTILPISQITPINARLRPGLGICVLRSATIK